MRSLRAVNVDKEEKGTKTLQWDIKMLRVKEKRRNQ